MRPFLKNIGILVLLMFSTNILCQKKSDALNLIDIESNIKNMEIINLSQFANVIQYIPFESKEGHFFTVSSDISILGNQILIKSQEGCLLYNLKGNFISKIGRIGTGPGEYTYCNLIGFDDDKKIYLQSTNDLYEFNNNGSFEKKYSKAFLFENAYYLQSVKIINNGLFFGHVPNSTGQIKYTALILDKSGHIQHYYKNNTIFNRKKEIASSFENFADINKFKSSVFYKEFYNDTLFYLNNKYQLIPSYVFNFGKFKEPVTERANMPLDMSKYLYIWNVFQTEDYLFLKCQFGDLFPAKRLTPKSSQFGNVYYNTKNVLGIYDKRINDLVFCKPTSTDNPLFTSGIYNDIDAGPRFFPAKQINDSTMAMWIDAKQLKDHVASTDFKNNPTKYPEKKKALEKLTNSLTDLDNPVLMIVTFEK